MKNRNAALKIVVMMSAAFLVLSAPAGALMDFARTYFTHTPTLMPGDTIMVTVINTLYTPAQRAQVGLYNPDGTPIVQQTQTLGVGGSATDGMAFRWKYTGAQPADYLVLGVGHEIAGAFWTVTLFDSNMAITGIFDSGTFYDIAEPGNVTHGPGAAAASSLTVGQFQNYPNPFKASDGTHIAYVVDGILDNVTVRIWTTSGRLIKTIPIPYPANRYVVDWDGRDDSGRLVTNGVYIAEIAAVGGGGAVSKKLALAVIGL